MKRNRAAIPLVFALLYGISPVDLIPDLIPLLGVLDDAVIVPLLLFMAYRFWRARPVGATPTHHGRTVIEARPPLR